MPPGLPVRKGLLNLSDYYIKSEVDDLLDAIIAEGSLVNYYTKTQTDILFSAKENSITSGTTLQYWRGDKSWQTLNTAGVPELTNLYYTDARARASVSETITGIDYNATTGVFSLTSGYVIPTTIEETNWNTAYSNRITSLTVTGSSGAAALISNVLNIPTYTLAGLGGISLSSLSATSPIFYNSGVISSQAATTSVNGYLTSTDWTTFNNKQTALSGTGFVKISGTTISYDNSTYLTGNQTVTLSGDVSGSGATAITTTLATVNSNVGSFGSTTQVGVFTVNGKGLITSASNATIDLSSRQPLNSNLTTIAGLTATTDNFIVSVGSAWASRTPAQVKATLAIANTDVSGLGTLATQNGTFSGTSSGTNTGDQTITLTGAVTGSGTGSFTTTLTSAIVGISNLSATGTPSSTTFLRGDNTWATPAGGISDGDKGDITVSSSGATWTIDNSVVTLAKMADMATASLIGRNTGGTGVPEVLSASTTRTLLGLVIGTNVQAYNANLTTYAGIAPSSNVQTLLGAADYSAFKTSLSLNSVENTALSTWAGTSNITTLGTITTGTWSGTSIAVNKGGTNLTSYAVGDLIYASASTTLSKLTIGSSAQILIVNTGIPSWQTVSGDITITNAGVTAIGSSKITNTMLAGSIASSKLIGTDIATIGTVTSGTLSTGTVVSGVTMTLGSDASYDMYYRNSSGILTRLANGTNGLVLTSTASSAPSWVLANAGLLTGFVSGAGTISASDSILQAINKLDGNLNAQSITAYTSTGANTYTMPTGAKSFIIVCIGAGGGGGSGRKDANNTNRYGGGGGGSGAVSIIHIKTTDLSGTTITCTVGAGGGGGASRSSTTDGATGTAGGDTTVVNNSVTICKASGGSGGIGGTNALGTGGAGGTIGDFLGLSGGSSSTSATAGAGTSSVNKLGGAGGAGGGSDSSENWRNGGAGGSGYFGLITGGVGGVAGVSAGTAGTAPNNAQLTGSGGGGGALGAGATTGKDGARGAGGGGGSAGNATQNSGAGGSGGNGYILIFAYF